MARTYRVAVIGRTGKGDYGHGLDKVWQALDNTEIVAVADEDEKGRAAAAKRLQARQAYADYRQMLEKEKPQIVSVAPRWLDCHRDMVVACAEAGASIFLEKPMARTLAEADAMVTACERHHVKLAIAHQTRYSPRVKRVKEMLAAGELGDLLAMHGRGKEDARGGGQDLMVLGTHILDLMRFFSGDARRCTARILQHGKPATKADVKEGGERMGPVLGDQLHATYDFDKGIMGTFGSHQAKAGAGQRFGLFLQGSKGMVHLTTGSLPRVLFLDEPGWLPGKTTWREITTKDEPQGGSAGLDLGNVWIAKDLIAAIEEDRQPLGGMYDGRASLEMILAVYESKRTQGSVTLPLRNRQHPLLSW